MKRIAFVTNFCPFYRIKLFETLSDSYEMMFLFYSEGKEWYWQKSHGVQNGNFNSKYLPGFWVGKTRVTITLLLELLRGRYDVFIKCINGKFALPSTYILAKILGKPFILYTGIWMRLESVLHKVIFPLTRYIYRNADAIVVYGQHIKTYLISEGVQAEIIFVAPHAVDNAAYQIPQNFAKQKLLKEQLEIPERKKIILYLGRLEAMKGVDTLIKAFALLNRDDTILIIAGDGTLAESLLELTSELEIQQSVRFPGYIERENTIDYYDLADIFVLPSVTVPTGKEPWGLTINEVFNRGIPVVTSNVVGAAAGGLVEDQINGLIFEENNISAFADALNELLENENKRKSFGKNASKKINSWDIGKMAEGFVEAIEYVTRRNS
ncbi:MAG: glycosyltransferase family 4 protein [Anaerolineaceae bacterium]|nr:glycosyltransferase family 4 protein [Anaerolineaceae bacterium]